MSEKIKTLKTSELIERLSGLMKEYGDNEIFTVSMNEGGIEDLVFYGVVGALGVAGIDGTQKHPVVAIMSNPGDYIRAKGQMSAIKGGSAPQTN